MPSISASKLVSDQDRHTVASPVLSLKAKNIEFDDLLKYNATSKSVYRELDTSLPKYFGQPSPEIDAAWHELLWPEYPAVSPDELKQNRELKFEEKDRLSATGQFHVALDVFHDLHCLNAVRKELDKEYYGGHHHHGSIESREVMAAAQRDHIGKLSILILVALLQSLTISSSRPLLEPCPTGSAVSS